jgi:hypothetical protein
VSTWAITRNDTTPQVMLDWISFSLKKMSQAASMKMLSLTSATTTV